MKWNDMRRSGNVEDRRGMSPGFGRLRMGGGGMRLGGLGLGGVVVLVALTWALGGDPMQMLSDSEIGMSDPGLATGPTGAPADDAGAFASSVLGDTEDVWSDYFRRAGASYPTTTLVLFDDEVDSACGFASAAVGPFYCPRDKKVYLDLSFFRELDRRFGAPGDFAQAYVIAHEVGHHVQDVLGLLMAGGGNAQSVQQELQADCLAGMWGRSASARGKLEIGDVEEGLAAAAAIGDDRLQRAAQGRVVPESFTHGSSAQRVAALRQGLNSTDLAGCGVR